MVVNIDKFDFTLTADELEVKVTVPGTTEQEDPWRQVYIRKITIGTQNAYDKDSGNFIFSDNGVTTSGDDYIRTDYDYGWIFEAPSEFEDISIYRIFELGLPLTDKKLITDLFFIKIETGGNYLADDIPCSMTGDTWSSLYDNFSVDTKGMQYIKELTTDCTVPTGMVDYIINKEALDVAAGCGDYSTMIDRYDDLMNITYTSTSTSGTSNNYKICGCNG